MKLINIAYCLMLYSLSIYQVSYAEPRFPQEFMFLNKPIDPVCISHPWDDSQHGMVDLNKCGMAQSHFVFDDYNDTLKNKGYYGWNWKDLSDPTVPNRGSGYYKFWDAGDHKFWVVAYFDGGGSGNFSTVSLFTRKDYHTVQMDILNSGDRCNGEVDKAMSQGNNLKFSTYITPADFFSLADDAKKDKAGENVYACASCCVATAYYEADSKDKKVKFLYVDLSTHPIDNMVDENEKYQVCFNKLLMSYVIKGKTKLNEVELKEFVKSYHDKCE
jgi:hypothetical protein